jgi:hypothetical protein
VPTFMCLYWDQGGPYIAVNEAFEQSFMTTKRMRE